MRRVSHVSAVLMAIALGATSCARAGATPRAEAQAEARPAVPMTVVPNPALAQAGSASIADIAERALPSVVNISMSKKVKVRQSPFPFFFGPSEPGERQEHGLGSGVIVSNDGTILTNNHVVSDASEIKVTTYDKREFDATVLGSDPKTDLAVIRIKGNPSGLKPIEFGDSSRLRLGDVVLAIGNPFGVGQTVTMGIVSAKGRADLGIVDYEDFIQTDAAINPGNSGGALVNMQGQLVGVNTAILSRTGGSQGIGFAIPTNMAAPIIDVLKKNGHVVRGWLGVGIQDVDSDLAAALKLPSRGGVLISDVKPDTPAAHAGIKRGDVVLKLDGHDVVSAGEFRNAIALAGSRKANLEIVREGKHQAVSVDVGVMPGDTASASGNAAGSASPSAALDGLTLEEINADNRRAFEIAPDVQRGLVITRLDPHGAAAKAGLRPGDVLLEVNRTPVESLAKFQELYQKSSGPVLLLISRHGSTVYLVVHR